MANMVSGIIRLSIEVVRMTQKIPVSSRGRKAILTLLDYPAGTNGWMRPRDLVTAAGSETKTTETWRELVTLGLLEVSNEGIKKSGRITHPTRFRIIPDVETIYWVFCCLHKYPEYEELLMKLHIEPPRFFIEHKDIVREAIKKQKEDDDWLKQTNKEFRRISEVIGKKRK